MRRLPEQKSKGVRPAGDPRAAKTRARIGAAFLALIARRPYAALRVSDIVRKAGVGRATFYAHFRSKDALLSSELARVVLPMLVELPGDPCLFDCTAFFAHVQHARPVYCALMTGPSRAAGEPIVQYALERRVAAVLAGRLGAGPASAAEAPGFVPRFVAGTLLALMAWTAEQPAAPPPATLQAMYRSLVGRALSGS